MKRFALMISLLLSILCMTQAKDRIVERPPFLAQSSSSIEIDKIVMSDTVTTVYIKAFYRPKYWIKIATGSFLKDNNGNNIHSYGKFIPSERELESHWIRNSGCRNREKRSFNSYFPQYLKM